MGKTSIWSRLGNLFATRTVESAGEEPAAAVVGVPSGADRGGQEALHPIPVDSAPASRPMSAARESDAERLAERHAVVIELVKSIRGQVELQGQRAERMAQSLDRLAANLERFPEASQAQSQLLSDMNKLMEMEAVSTRHTEELLSQIPRVADAQLETMSSMGRQLDLLRKTGDCGADKLARLEEAVGRLSEATGASTAALKDMGVDSAARQDHLADLLRELTNRLTLLGWLMMAVVAVVGAVLVFVVLIR